MSLDNTALLPPSSRIRTVMTKIGTELTPIVETVRYFLRLPEEETDDLVAYIEFSPPMTIVNESLQSSQRSWITLPIVVYLYVNESDTRILADLIEHATETLMAASAITNYRNAFSTDVGFSIEKITVAEVGFGDEYGQVKLIIEVLMHHEV